MPAETTPRIKPSKRPRYRYILFQVGAEAPDRNGLIRQIQAVAPASTGAWLTRYEAGRGILRVLRGKEQETRRALEGMTSLRIRTVSTSGTIAALERGHGNGRRRQRRED